MNALRSKEGIQTWHYSGGFTAIPTHVTSTLSSVGHTNFLGTSVWGFAPTAFTGFTFRKSVTEMTRITLKILASSGSWFPQLHANPRWQARVLGSAESDAKNLAFHRKGDLRPRTQVTCFCQLAHIYFTSTEAVLYAASSRLIAPTVVRKTRSPSGLTKITRSAPNAKLVSLMLPTGPGGNL